MAHSNTKYYQTTQPSQPPNYTVYPTIYDISEDDINIYYLSRTVQLLALIDICFGFLYGFFNYYFFIPLIFAFLGYFGARNYASCSVLSYATYQIFCNIARMSLTIYNYIDIRENNQEVDYKRINWQLVLAIILCLIGLYIARFSFILWQKIRNLTVDDINKLISIDRPTQIVWW